MKNFNWQHIQFTDGSNPYVCTTMKSFDFMNKKYNLIKIKEGFWLAKEKEEVKC